MAGNGSFPSLFLPCTTIEFNHIINLFVVLYEPCTYTEVSEASKDIKHGNDAQAMTLMRAKEDVAALFVPKTYISPFEGLSPKSLETVGAPSLYFFPVAAQNVMSTMLSKLMDATEVSNMVKLLNEAFQCLGVFNL